MEVAEAGKGVYVRAGHSDFGLQGILSRFEKWTNRSFNL